MIYGGSKMSDNNKPICPLLTSVAPGMRGGVATACQKDKCAWWIEDKQKCAITVMGGSKK